MQKANSITFQISGVTIDLDFDTEQVGLPAGISRQKLAAISIYLVAEGFLDKPYLNANKTK